MKGEDPEKSDIKIKDIAETIRKSGFPLQTLIANQLAPTFYVQEEWAFTDSDSQETRTLDIFAQKKFWHDEKDQPLFILIVE